MVFAGRRPASDPHRRETGGEPGRRRDRDSAQAAERPLAAPTAHCKYCTQPGVTLLVLVLLVLLVQEPVS